MSPPIEVTHFTDPGCPWAYSASPAHTVLRWRYGDGLSWRLVMIGLTEDASQYERRGYTPARVAQGYRSFRRFGMPLRVQPKAAVAATSPACRAIVAARLLAPGSEEAAYRALQLMQFTSAGLLDRPGDLRGALETVPGLDAARAIEMIDAPQVREAYERDRAEARSAAGSPTEAQDRAAATDGAVRYTAPSLVFQAPGQRLEAGGFQPLEAYDVLIANLDPTLARTPPPPQARAVLERFPAGLTTQEVAAVMTPNNLEPYRAEAEGQLIELVAEGVAQRVPVGDDALWRAT
ncbi:MAG: hypothetical protein E6G56_10705 [Actinobacteria bacterium]|nr:MAG: hypothetical protein E6G56_10705 [Actinomycetota bacterium]